MPAPLPSIDANEAVTAMSAEPDLDQQVTDELEALMASVDAPATNETAEDDGEAESSDQDAPSADATSAAGSAEGASSSAPSGEGAESADVVSFLDRQLTREEAQQLAGLYDWAAGLTPQQAQQIVDLTSGQYTLAPQGVAVDSNVGAAQAQPAATAAPESAKIDWDTDLTDPAVIKAYEAMQARIDELEARTQVAAASASQAAQLEAERGINAARAEIATRYGLSDVELDVVAQRAVQSQITPLLRQQMADASGHVDPTVLFTEVFDRTVWTDPKLREAALQHQNATSRAEVAQIQTTNASKKAKASAVSSTSGSVPRTAPAPRNLSPVEVTAAMTQEIAQAMGG